jgi:hypothetical protein
MVVGINSTGNSVLVRLRRGATSIGTTASGNTASTFISSTFQVASVAFEFVDNPATTSPLTYGVQISNQGGSASDTHVNRRHSDTIAMGISTITVEEIN